MMQYTIGKTQSKFSMYDQAYLWGVILLLGLGLMMVFSASMTYAGMSQKFGNDEFFFIKRQSAYVVAGLLWASVVYRVPMRVLQKYATSIFIIGIVLLGLLMVPGIGVTLNNSTRWINLLFFYLQPSELMKLIVIIYVADFAVRKADVMHHIGKSFLPVLAVMVLIGSLLMWQPDLSTFIVIASITICMLWLAGINLSIFAVILFNFILFVYIYIDSAAYRNERVQILLNGPWDDMRDSGFQIGLSLMAYGRGGVTGVGLGGSVTKLYLPEAYNDFLIAVIAEELGLLGVLLVIGLIGFVVIRGFQIGKQAQHYDRPFSALLAFGISLLIAIQSIVHMGGSMNILPSTGVNLPLMSFGGSGMLVMLSAIAIMLRIDYENRCIQKGIHV